MKPETGERASPPVPPKLIISKPSENAAEATGGSKEHIAGSKTTHREHRRRHSSEWVDIDEAPARRRRTRKPSSQRFKGDCGSSSSRKDRRRDTQGGSLGFFPRLGRILEVNESTTSSRPSTRGSDQRRHRDKSPARRSRDKNEVNPNSRRTTGHRAGGVQRRGESLLKVNPSLLSVLSTLTGMSDRSSGSSSTVTQQSYNRRHSEPSRPLNNKVRHMESETRSNMTSRTLSNLPSVFDYMEPYSADESHDGHSVISSSSSHYESSDAGSSIAPDTPSSRSTFPSPTTTRNQSVADLRKKYDPQYAASVSSARSNSSSPNPSLRSLRKRPSVSDVPEEDEQGDSPPPAPTEIEHNPRRSSSGSSRGSRRSAERWQQHEESMREHMAYAQHQHYVDPVYGQHRSFSTSSEHSDPSAYAYQMAMQHYQWPSPPVPAPPQTMNGHIAHHGPPPAPDAPDLSQRTLAGYEELALELSASRSPVKPLYRKFEYLNHRILLHLQDELSELEEQLRTVDEIIAQMDPGIAEGQKTPASRRGDNFHGEIHLRRTHLLGNIFVKTEQYNRAMSAYASMAKHSLPANEGQVSAYQQWMAKHSPIHEVEQRFLRQEKDLVVPGAGSTSPDRHTKHAALAYLPMVLMLPLLLFSIIPTLAGRLVVTALIGIGAFIIASTTSIQQLMRARDWAVSGAMYVLLMAAIAGCIPQYKS
ncbi:hypothetical protein LTR37_016482 [Vermiconidia calcicola]|uniref:Uncharacterized protein n=1 Tax=Vermiconidia calcicola TaxID=1690605 RepID=A0ACC3MMV2_9PEZI|nr:hypothetical protein LTR37_016482 [Vermiconidia calcicola]